MTTMVDDDLATGLKVGMRVDRTSDGWAPNNGVECRFGADLAIDDSLEPPIGARHVLCSRKQHPLGTKHVGLANRIVAATWRTETSEAASPEVDEPMDAVPLDVKPGDWVRFKGRGGLMSVLGRRSKPTSTGDVEVVDVVAQRFRVVDARKLAFRRPDKDMPTPEQVKWLADWMSGKRAQTRQTAIDQKSNFTSTEFVNLLNELELPPIITYATGPGRVQFRLTAPAGTNRDQAREVLLEALTKLVLPEGYSWNNRSVVMDRYDWDMHSTA